MKTLKTKTEKLERLCRAMQGERTKLRDEIKAVSPPSLSACIVITQHLVY